MTVMNKLQAMERIELFPAGRVLFSAGEVPDGVYIIHSGRVDLVFSGRNGVTKVLRSLKAGAIAGLSDAVSNTPHDCTAATRRASRIGWVGIDDFRRLLSEQPAQWLEIAAMLSVDLAHCWGSMRTLAAPR
jgi:CRP-like cAMP-binding protein